MIDDYILVRKKRKSIGLYLTKDGKLKVHAPLNLSVKVIEETIEHYQDWINERIKAIREARPPKTYTEGEEFPYLGQHYKLKFTTDQASPVLLKDEICIDKQYEKHAESALKFWYWQEAEKLLVQRTLWYSTQLLLKHKRIKISKATTRWGSCSNYGSINLNWRLIMAPIQVIDLVVVHELMHLNQMDHSQTFWKKVEKLIPDYMQWEKWLKVNGRTLDF